MRWQIFNSQHFSASLIKQMDDDVELEQVQAELYCAEKEVATLEAEMRRKVDEVACLKQRELRGAVQKNFRANLGFCPNRLDPPSSPKVGIFTVNIPEIFGKKGSNVP